MEICVVCNEDADFILIDGGYYYCFQCIREGKAQ
jgi:hypothetical protein